MANPKRRTSHHRSNIRRSHLALKPTQSNSCARCGSAVRTHRVCDNCGFYGFSKGAEKKGADILEKEEY